MAKTKIPAGDTGHLVAFVIINSIPPYAYEVNNILALPNDTPYRARYQKKWAPDIKNPGDLEQHDAVITLRNWNDAQLIPLRRARITQVDTVGDIYYISYLLYDLIEYASDETTRQKQLHDFNENMALQLKAYTNQPRTDLEKLIFFAPDLAASISDSSSQIASRIQEYDNWGKIVNLIGTMDCFIDIDFLKVYRVLGQQNKLRTLEKVLDSKRFMLATNETYSLEVFQRSYTQKGVGDSSVSHRTIDLSGEPDAVQVVKNSYAVAGKYDRYEFRFRTQAVQRVRDTDLVLQITRKDDKLVPTIYIPIRISTSKWKLLSRIVAVFLFILGAILLFFADSLFPQYVDIAKSIAIFVMILTGPETRDFAFSLLNRLNLTLSSG